MAPQPAALQRINTNAALLADVELSKQVVLEFTNVNAHVPIMVATTQPAGSAKAAASSDAPKERQILFDVSGVVEPGSLLALMGPSGSGKSSLLSLLGGRSTARLTGSILFNGQPMTKPIKRSTGFVTQDDLLYAELTTFETLDFAALLRLPRSWSRDAKLARVEMVLHGLGLDKARDTIIGNHQMRGVSGGERKRVSIGHELLINPSVIFLDEPTSGLDSTTALKLVHTLRSLASGGRTIVASIHQPSSRLYQEFDKLMLLSEGHVMYYGDAHISANWFALHGAPVPFGVSTPDHLLDLACADLPGRTKVDSEETRDALVEAYRTRKIGTGRHGIQPSDYPDAEVAATNPTALLQHKSKRVPSSVNLHSGPITTQVSSGAALTADTGSASSGRSSSDPPGAVSVSIAKLADAGIELQDTDIEAGAAGSGQAFEVATKQQHADKWGATWVQQVAILTSRCVRIRRFTSLSIQRFAEVLVVAALSGLFWFQIGGHHTLSHQDVRDLSGLLFFQALFMSFSAMFMALFAFPADFSMLVKERQSGMYRLSSYYFARALSDIPMDCLVPTLFCIVIYFLSGLRLGAGFFFANWWSMLLTMLVAQSLGLLIGATVMHTRTAMAIATICMLCIMLVGGFYVQNIPDWISWIKYGSFIYYGYNLLLKIEFGGRGYSCGDYYKDNPNAPPGKTWCPVSESGVFTADVDKSPGLEVGVLLAFLFGLRTLIYVALRHKTTFKNTNKQKSS